MYVPKIRVSNANFFIRLVWFFHPHTTTPGILGRNGYLIFFLNAPLFHLHLHNFQQKLSIETTTRKSPNLHKLLVALVVVLSYQLAAFMWQETWVWLKEIWGYLPLFVNFPCNRIRFTKTSVLDVHP